MWRDKNIILGVTGGIAAYKSVGIARRLVEQGANVQVVMTKAATEFVTPLTFAAVTGQRVITTLFDSSDEPIYHISATNSAHLIIVAPASADFIARMAAGLANDALAATVLAAGCPVLLAPAMNTRMWQNQATQDNVRLVKERAIRTIGPAEGPLAEGYGEGRMAEEGDIIDTALTMIKGKQTLQNKRVIITAGGTQEKIDIVRYLGNRSSGKMGYALAAAAAARGAKVTLISAPTELLRPADVDFVKVVSAEEMRAAVVKRYPKADIVVMAAAVADLRATEAASGKIKKGQLATLKLEATPDILAELGAKKKHQWLIGFSAESSDLIHNAQVKLENKKIDVIVANDISRSDIGLGSDFNQATILTADGRVEDTARLSKPALAALIFDEFTPKG